MNHNRDRARATSDAEPLDDSIMRAIDHVIREALHLDPHRVRSSRSKLNSDCESEPDVLTDHSQPKGLSDDDLT